MNPTQEQLSFIEAPGRHVMAIAGPGSGKTQSLAWRIARDIKSGINAKDMVVITFTNQAANELRARVCNVMCEGDEHFATYDQPGYIGTLHSWCLAVCQRAVGRLTVLDEHDSIAILQTVAETMRYRGSLAGLRKSLQTGINVDDALGNIVLKQYRQHLQVHHAIDLDLILLRARHILESGMVRVSALYVDEYQDSSLADEAVYDAVPADLKVFVGDPDQSIYAFRGGTLANLMNRFARMEKDPQATIVRLESNFRSGVEICTKAQTLIGHAEYRVPKQTVSQTAWSGEVLRMRSDTDAEEICKVISVLKGFQKREQWEWQDMAVLCRYNYQAHDIARQLPPNDVPAARKRLDDLPEDWGATKALLGLLVDPRNGLANAVWKRHKDGTPEAKKAIAKGLYQVHAKQAMFEAPTSLAKLAQIMFDEGISKESQERVLEAGRTQGDNFDLPALLVTLHRDQECRHEVGHGVTVTTMHASKGREWKLVILAGFEDEIIPGKTDREDEERRLAYVGVTRASHVLILSWALTRKDPYRPDYIKTQASRFLGEMGLSSQPETA